MLSGPSLVALTLAILANAVLGAEGMTGLLVTHGARPALLAAALPPVAHPSAAAVHGAHLCRHTQTHTGLTGPLQRCLGVYLWLGPGAEPSQPSVTASLKRPLPVSLHHTDSA